MDPTDENAVGFYRANIASTLRNKDPEMTDGYYNSSLLTSNICLT